MNDDAAKRVRVEVVGAVQGVGFRPFVYSLATELALAGWVLNDPSGVVIEVEGPEAVLRSFLHRLETERPALAEVRRTTVTWADPSGHDAFRIRSSDAVGPPSVQVLPDVATCGRCLEEVLDPADRRHGYPFTNCTFCGPRFSIVRSLPYDRPRTTMAAFPLCDACRREYEDPRDRRFHAQPVACPVCGPRWTLRDADGRPVAGDRDPLPEVVAALRRGAIVAVKGLGGFHLVVDARDGEAVRRLRWRKPRRAKPFALMVRDPEQARSLCRVDAASERALLSAAAPIVLLERLPDAEVDEAVAPGNPRLGLMLPYTPLHHLLLRATGFPLVATSGNLSDEPICTDEDEAAVRLRGVAELYLVHDRPIARHVDDSVVWNVAGDVRLLRRARGYAPRPLLLGRERPTLLAVGAHLKNAVALGVRDQVFVSQHIGDMETPEALAAFERVILDFLDLYEAEPVALAHDLHPDYASTRWARRAVDRGRLAGLPLVAVQHHHAHLASCLADNDADGAALGVTWDGTGYGGDGTVWGGEFLLGDAAAFARVACLRPFGLPGGEAAVHEPRRVALAVLHDLLGDEAYGRDDLEPVRSFSSAERTVLRRMVRGGTATPRTTSAGRLFDAVASLLGLHQRVAFEGQAAMALEHVADPSERGTYPVDLDRDARPALLDWRPLIAAILHDRARGVAPATVAGRFHNALVESVVAVARLAGAHRVALGGGCFQNRLLLERTVRRLGDAGHEVLLHRRVPPNDGGIALGQIAVAAARIRDGRMR